MIGEEVYFLSGKNEWRIGIVTGTTDTGRIYNILTDEGTSLRRNRSHLKPRYYDIPIILRTLPFRTSTPWEVLMWFDSEVAARVSGAAETVDYFG